MRRHCYPPSFLSLLLSTLSTLTSATPLISRQTAADPSNLQAGLPALCISNTFYNSVSDCTSVCSTAACTDPAACLAGNPHGLAFRCIPQSDSSLYTCYCDNSAADIAALMESFAPGEPNNVVWLPPKVAIGEGNSTGHIRNRSTYR